MDNVKKGIKRLNELGINLTLKDDEHIECSPSNLLSKSMALWIITNKPKIIHWLNNKSFDIGDDVTTANGAGVITDIMSDGWLAITVKSNKKYFFNPASVRKTTT